jgi:hypothetical protein
VYLVSKIEKRMSWNDWMKPEAKKVDWLNSLRENLGVEPMKRTGERNLLILRVVQWPTAKEKLMDA